MTKDKDDNKWKPVSFEERLEKQGPLGQGPGGQLLIFNSIEEAKAYAKANPPILIDPDDDGVIPDEGNYDKL